MAKKLNIKFKRIIICFIFSIILVILVSLYLFLNKEYGFEIPCIFHKITNLYCPGCGITRMILSMINLNFYQAFRYNQLVFILSPFLLIYIIYSIIMFINNNKNNLLQKIPTKYIVILLIITITYGIMRNIDMFSYLKPTIIK